MTPEDKRKQLVMDYHNTFGSEHGKRVLADLKRLSTIDRPAMSPKPSPIDTNRLIYDEAQRSLVLYIIKNVETTLDEKKPTQTINEGVL